MSLDHKPGRTLTVMNLKLEVLYSTDKEDTWAFMDTTLLVESI